MQGMSTYSVPGLSESDCTELAAVLQERLSAYNDLHLTLKHVHWNVVGPNFIGVHEMLDEQVEAARAFTDDVAERIATLGHVPKGTPGYVAHHRTWDDYSIGRGLALEHLAALDEAYNGLIADHRKAAEEFEKLDPVSQAMLIGQVEKLEMYQWFVRAHLEDAGGNLAHGDATGEREAAEAGAAAERR